MNRDHIEIFKVYNKSTSHCLWQKKCHIFTKLLYFPPGHTGRPYFTAQLISRSQKVFPGQWNLKEYDIYHFQIWRLKPALLDLMYQPLTDHSSCWKQPGEKDKMEKQSEAKHKLKTSLCSHQVCWKALQTDQGVWNLKDHDATDQI